MSGRVRVTIGRVTVEGAAIADPTAFRAEVERQVALGLGAPAAINGLTGRHLASARTGPVKAAGDPSAIAGAVAAAIGGGRKP